MEKLAKAVAFAADRHQYQTDKSGEPYIFHCLTVMENTRAKLDKNPDIKGELKEDILCAAVLHDVVEDCAVTILELSMSFGRPVATMVRSLTKIDDEVYEEYLDRILDDYRTILIKMSDIEHNSDFTRLKGVGMKDIKRMEKYQKAYATLKNEAINYHEVNV